MTRYASAIIVAAGSGVRFGSAGKAFAPLAGKPMVSWSLNAFSRAEFIGEIVLVAGEHTIGTAEELLASGNWPKLRSVVLGGALRQDSVRLGVLAANREFGLLAIHDAARPLVTPEDIDSCVRLAAETGAAILGVPVADTLKRVASTGMIEKTISRDAMWAAQTPQTFARDLLFDAFDRCEQEGWQVTDDASMVELSGGVVSVVKSNAENFKVTTQEDAVLAEQVLSARSAASAHLTRTGFGYDVHRFADGRRLMLGGVEIPSERGLDGHSDADVLLHAITDAVLGSVGLGDIGVHFPPNDEQWRDAASLIFLKHANELLLELGGRVIHVDATIIAEAPKIMKHAAVIRATIAEALGLSASAVSIKATTNEGMGFIGREEGIAAMAVATVIAPIR